MAFSLTREQYLELYYFLRLNRELELRMEKLFRQNQIPGALYSSLGQEAISVGAAYALGSRDWMAPMIRNIGALLVRGFPPRDVLTQHMARYTSPTQGKDGTSHFCDLQTRHMVSPISMLGDLIPVMTGVAMAGRVLGQNIVALTWIGDGGTSTGAFHEGLNLAAVQKAALVLIVENNQWAYSTPVERQVPLRNLAGRAKAYGIASRIVDGNDVLAMVQATRQAVAQARSGRGPVLIEAKTMRMRGHAQHDDARYMPEGLLASWKKRDPLTRYENVLTKNKLWNATSKQELDARVAREIQADLEFAETSPAPPPESAERGVYCKGCHTVEAEWARPREELMPPQSNTKAQWSSRPMGIAKSAAKPVAAKGRGARATRAGAGPAGTRR